MGSAGEGRKRQRENRVHRGAQIRRTEHFAAIPGWRAGARRDPRGWHNRRGRDAECEDDPVGTTAHGRGGAEEGKAAGGFRSAWRSDDDAESVRSAEPRAGADWREDFCEPAKFGGRGGARPRSHHHSDAEAGFLRVLPAGGWKSAVRETFGVSGGTEAITVPRFDGLEVVQW